MGAAVIKGGYDHYLSRYPNDKDKMTYNQFARYYPGYLFGAAFMSGDRNDKRNAISTAIHNNHVGNQTLGAQTRQAPTFLGGDSEAYSEKKAKFKENLQARKEGSV